MNPLETHLTLAVIIPLVIQFLKNQSWFPLVNFNNGTLNRLTSWFIAALTGLGIGIDFNTTGGVLTITGLTAASLWAGAQHAVVQMALNHGVYKMIVAPPQPGIEQAQARDAAKIQPPEFYVGEPLFGTSARGVKPGDPMKVGGLVTVDGVTYIKISDTVYDPAPQPAPVEPKG